jgi:hypothetical protein
MGGIPVLSYTYEKKLTTRAFGIGDWLRSPRSYGVSSLPGQSPWTRCCHACSTIISYSLTHPLAPFGGTVMLSKLSFHKSNYWY